MVRNGVPMRSLVATVDLAANRRVAAYPVELVSDEDDYDRTYALGVYLEVRRRNSNPAFGGRFTVGERELDNISGVPTRKSLASAYFENFPTLAMYRLTSSTPQCPNPHFLSRQFWTLRKSNPGVLLGLRGPTDPSWSPEIKLFAGAGGCRP